MRKQIQQTMRYHLGGKAWWDRIAAAGRRSGSDAPARRATASNAAGQQERRPPVVGIFGKHPAWPDHIALPLPSAAVRELRARLYEGIQQAISRNAWDDRAPQQIISFGHHFCVAGLSDDSGWIIGRLWESADSVGRREYPMVACVHVFDVDCEIAMKVAAAELHRLADACRVAGSREQVQLALDEAERQVRDRAIELAPPAQVAVAAGVPQPESKTVSAVVLGWLRQLAGFAGAQMRRFRFRGRPRRNKGVRLHRRETSADEALCRWAGAAWRRCGGRVAVFAACPDSGTWADVAVGGITARAVERLRLADGHHSSTENGEQARRRNEQSSPTV